MNTRNDMITVFVVRPDESGGSHEFLQLHRSPSDYLGNTWQIVRGGVERNETFATAALRELREETGLVPREFYRLGAAESFHTDADDTLWHSVAFCAIVGRDQVIVLNEEHDAYRWVHRTDIDALTLWASERSLQRDLFRDILDDGIAKQFLRMEI